MIMDAVELASRFLKPSLNNYISNVTMDRRDAAVELMALAVFIASTYVRTLCTMHVTGSV